MTMTTATDYDKATTKSASNVGGEDKDIISRMSMLWNHFVLCSSGMASLVPMLNFNLPHPADIPTSKVFASRKGCKMRTQGRAMRIAIRHVNVAIAIGHRPSIIRSRNYFVFVLSVSVVSPPALESETKMAISTDTFTSSFATRAGVINSMVKRR